MLPHTTKRKITNLKSINQKCQKIKLHGTPTTKELKKKIDQNHQTGRVVDHKGGVGCSKAVGCSSYVGGADFMGNRPRVDTAVGTLEETPSLTQESHGKCARDK